MCEWRGKVGKRDLSKRITEDVFAFGIFHREVGDGSFIVDNLVINLHFSYILNLMRAAV